MKQVSVWASHHKWAARFFILLLYIALNATGMLLGLFLQEGGIIMPEAVFYLAALPFLAAFVSYPSRHDKSKYKNFYRSRKIADGVLLATTFVFIVCIANGNHSFLNTYPAGSAVEPSATATRMEKGNHKIFTPSVQRLSGAKAWKKQLRANVLWLLREYKDMRNGGKIALIILATLIAAALMILLLALFCHLTCSGSEGLAVLVLVLGTGLIVFLLYKVIQSINRKYEKKPEESTAVHI